MTDLRQALHGALLDEPPLGDDLGWIVQQGRRRVRRRRATVLTTAVAAVSITAAALLLPSDAGRRPDPRPAEPVHLRIQDAEQLDLDVLAQRRVTWRPPMNDLSHDRFEGLTTDGLVVRSRYDFDSGAHDVGLLDPSSGTTDWLPRLPGDIAEFTVAEATGDRLVLVDFRHLVVIDRVTREWQVSRMPIPEGADPHGWPVLSQLGPGGRLYLQGYADAHVPSPVIGMRWWSVPVPGGGVPRPEPQLDDRWVAWAGDRQVVGDPRGRVTATVGGVEQILAQQPPDGCTRPEKLEAWPIIVGLADTWPVATYTCSEKPEARTVVYDETGRPRIEVAGAAFAEGDQHRILLRGDEDHGGLYVLDPDTLALGRVGPSGLDGQLALEGRLLLWNESGPIESRRIYDEVWKVARVPRA